MCVEQRARHRLTRRTYISTGTNYTWYIDGYDKLKPFGFIIHGARDGYSGKIIWLFVGSRNNDPKVIAYYFVNCVVDLQLVIKVNDFRSIRGGSRTAATSKMELFVIIVNGWTPLTIITKSSILDVAAV